MSRQSKEAEALSRLLDQAARALHALGFEADMFPAQWTALRYFARVEPKQRTASALARYQGIAVGPVTRTVRTLHTKGLVEPAAIRSPGPSKEVELTEAARKLLLRDPLRVVSDLMTRLTADQRATFAHVLELLVRELQVRHVLREAGLGDAPPSKPTRGVPRRKA